MIVYWQFADFKQTITQQIKTHLKLQNPTNTFIEVTISPEKIIWGLRLGLLGLS